MSGPEMKVDFWVEWKERRIMKDVIIEDAFSKIKLAGTAVFYEE